MNAVTDVLFNKLVNGLVAANMSVQHIPPFEKSLYIGTITSTGGPAE